MKEKEDFPNITATLFEVGLIPILGKKHVVNYPL